MPDSFIFRMLRIKADITKATKDFLVDIPLIIGQGEDWKAAQQNINRHNGKPSNSRTILIASDKPKFRESSRKDTERQF